MTSTTVNEGFFDRKYKENEDPWNFATDSYENSRYQAILHTVGHRRYKRIYEPGCSVGVLTSRLAAVGDQIEAMDISTTAVDLARKRCEPFSNVQISRGTLPEDLPAGPFDLIVFSEIGYYFLQGSLCALANALVDRLISGGTFVACHWLGLSPDHLLSGNEVHQVLKTVRGLQHESAECYPHFRIDRWERA